MNDKVSDDKTMKLNQDSPNVIKDNSLSMQNKSTLSNITNSAYQYLEKAKQEAYEFYVASLNHQGDVEIKGQLVDDARRITRVIERALELVESTHSKVSRMK